MPLTDSKVPPQIASALDELKGRVRGRFLLHGLGWIAVAVLGLLLVHFLLDRTLELPRLPRFVLLAAIAVFVVQGLRRRLLYPLQRAFSRRDLALLIERNHPELHHQLISAVQLDAENTRGESAAMIARVQGEAAERLRALDTSGVLRGDRTRRVWSGAGAAALAFGLAVALAPASFGIWCKRVLGFDADYPRDTFLSIEVPEGQGNYKIVSADDEDEIRVQLARGAELPVNVLVEGVVPPFVELVVQSDGGEELRVPMSRRGEARFRSILRRSLRPMQFFARGGDDAGTKRVRVEILVPPAATEIRTTVEAPAYTGLPARVTDGGLVEALPGSTVTLRFRATTPLAAARLEFQESEEKVEVAIGAEAVTDTSDVETKVHVARFTMPSKTDRYRLALEAVNGLSELSPSFHSVVPIPDEKPRVQLYAPTASLQAMTVDAKLPLRWFAKDDFGLARVALAASVGGADSEPSETELYAPPANEGGEVAGEGTPRPKDSAEARRERGAFTVLDVKALVPGARPPQVGDRIQLQVAAYDNRLPEPQSGHPQSFRIDLLDAEELSRRLQSKLRSTRATVERALRVQDEQKTRLETFLATVDSASGERRKLALAAAEAGQQRVRGFLLQIRSEFAASLEAHLFNGLDDSPEVATVLQRYVAFYEARIQHPATDPSFWVELGQARKDGKVGRLDLIGRLDDMLVLADSLLSQSNDKALRALSAASTAGDVRDYAKHMGDVRAQQDTIAEGLSQLLALLEDWNDYQDVVRITRRLRDAQRDLQERIKSKR